MKAERKALRAEGKRDTKYVLGTAQQMPLGRGWVGKSY